MKLTTNQAGVLNMLADAFTGRNTYVSELIQNARRAGASQVRITVTGGHGIKPSIMFKDDGCGISDFSKLMTLCESGWSEEVIESDSPYGVGFLSAILASQTFHVTSGRTRMRAVTKDLIAGKDAEFSEVSEEVKGTEVTLFLAEAINFFNFRDTLKELALANDIDIIFEGDLLKSPLRLSAVKWSEPVPGVGTLVWSGESSMHNFSTPNTYLQGLPIKVAEKRDNWNHTPWGLHLDSKKFRGRMPDRDLVLDTKYGDISEQVKAAQRALVARWFETLNGSPSTDEYKLIAEIHHELIDRVQAIPAGIFKCFDNPDCLEGYGQDHKVPYNETVSVDDNDFRYFPDVDIEDGTGLALALLLEEEGIPLVGNYRLPAWVKRRLIDYDDVQLSPVDEKSRAVNLNTSLHRKLDVIRCARVMVEVLSEDKSVLSGEIVESIYDGGTLYLTRDEVPYEVFLQENNYRDENGGWDDALIAEHLEDLQREYDLALSGDFAEAIRQALEPFSCRSELQGVSFKVTFDAMSAVQVEKLEGEK